MIWRFLIPITLVFLVTTVKAVNREQPLGSITPVRSQEMSAYEKETIRIENQRLEVEKLKAAVEQQKAQAESLKAKTEHDGQAVEWVKAIGTLLAVPVSIGVLIMSVFSLKKSVEAQTLTKLGELAMQAHSPLAVLNRATLLSKFYRKALPADFETTLNRIKTEHAGRSNDSPEVVAIRSALIKMMAEHPTQRSQILADWIIIWPNDEWAKRLRDGSTNSTH